MFGDEASVVHVTGREFSRLSIARAWDIDRTSARHCGRIEVIAVASRLVMVPASIAIRKGQVEKSSSRLTAPNRISHCVILKNDRCHPSDKVSETKPNEHVINQNRCKQHNHSRSSKDLPTNQLEKLSKS